MKKLGLVCLSLLLLSGVASAENGAKTPPYVSVSQFTTSNGSSYVFMYGMSNISEYNPGNTGSYVSLSENRSGISVSMYDIDTAKYGYCYIPSTDVNFEMAKRVMDIVNGTRGVQVSTYYTTDSSICKNIGTMYYTARS